MEVQLAEEKALEAQVFVLQEEVQETPVHEITRADARSAGTPPAGASGIPGRPGTAEPVSITLDPGAQPVRRKQRPTKLEGRKGLEPLLGKWG